MVFTKNLREENNDLFQEILFHPFVKGIGNGNVPAKSVVHYIKADYEYLNAFMKVYGIAISKSKERVDIEFFNQQIQFVLNSEVHPHHNFCDYIGHSYEDLKGYPLPPSADHYSKHMFYHATTGGLGEIIAALLPCPWTYLEIGHYLLDKHMPDDTHPFNDWIRFYTDHQMERVTKQLQEMLNKIAEYSSTEEKRKMKKAFRKSCQLEWSFWEMAYTCEQWPLEGKV